MACTKCVLPSPTPPYIIYKIIKRIIRIQIRIQIHGILILVFVIGAQTRVSRKIIRFCVVRRFLCGHIHRKRLMLFVAFVHDNGILQQAVPTYGVVQRFPQQIDIIIFQPFIKKLARNLNSKHFTIKFQWPYRFKPRFKTLFRNVLLNYTQAGIPDLVNFSIFGNSFQCVLAEFRMSKCKRTAKI
jgi:hypothetical protein